MGLREQAKLDARAILEDLSGFAWPVTLTSPLGVVSSVYGFTTDVGQTIDPETGQAVAGRRASFAVARASLPELPEAVAEATRKPWLASFADSQGVFAVWKVIEVLPDRAAGVVVLLLETFQRAIVHLTGALALPSGLELAGTVAPEVELAGALELPSGLELAGTVAPEVELAGALELPSLALAGTVAPAVGDLAGALTLPSLALSGTVAPVVGDLAGALALPSLALAGTVAPAVGVAGTLALPSLALAGTVAPAVSMSGSLTLPMLQLTGSLTVDANKTSGWLRLAASSQSGGEWTPSIVDVINAGSPAVQTDVDRRTAVGASANGFPTMVFDGSDMHLWPMSPAHSSTTKVGILLWYKPGSVAGTQWIYSVLGGVAGAPNNRIRFGSSGAKIYCEVYISAGSGRAFIGTTDVLAVGVWACIYMQYDSSRGGDPNLVLYVNGNLYATTASNAAGTPGPTGLTVLPSAGSGSAVIGAFNDSDTPTQPILSGGQIGPNIFAGNDNFTTGAGSEEAARRTYEQPT